MTTTHFDCPCGYELTALIFSGATSKVRAIRFVDRHTQKVLASCPNCHRDFSEVTPEEFEEKVWPMA